MTSSSRSKKTVSGSVTHTAGTHLKMLVRRGYIATDLASWAPLVIFVLANGLMLIVAASTHNLREYVFDIDYAIIVIFMAFSRQLRPRWLFNSIGIVLLALLMAVDVFTAFQRIYFTGPIVLLDYLPFVRFWPWRAIFPIGGLITIAASVVWVIGMPKSDKPFKLRGLLMLLVLLTAGDLGMRQFSSSAISMFPKNLMSSGLKIVAEPTIQHALSRLGHHPIEMRTWRTPTLFSILAETPDRPRRILSVSVESMGVEANQAKWDANVKHISLALGDEYELITARSQPYSGATLSGEARELCGIHFDNIPYADRDLAAFDGCIPAILARSGYVSSSWHGGDTWFYNRKIIYARMGFSKSSFFGDVAPSVSNVCSFLFVAVCDKDLLSHAVNSFGRSDREFVHVMTIDTHLPLTNPLIDCAAAADQQPCLFRSMLFDVFEDIGEAVAKAKFKPDAIFISGDHAPPFVDGRSRSEFRPGTVMWIAFQRKQ
jgi:hypothetical protein